MSLSILSSGSTGTANRYESLHRVRGGWSWSIKHLLLTLWDAWPAELLPQIQSQLAGLFSACLGNNSYENNWVYVGGGALVPVQWELIVYFAPSGSSLIKFAPGYIAPTGNPDGYTLPSLGASEVYMNYNDPILLSRLAFHELMHNRLQQGDSMHAQGGLASAVVDATTPFTDANKNAMAAVINQPITQWTTGLTFSPNDPRLVVG